MCLESFYSTGYHNSRSCPQKLKGGTRGPMRNDSGALDDLIEEWGSGAKALNEFERRHKVGSPLVYLAALQVGQYESNVLATRDSNTIAP